MQTEGNGGNNLKIAKITGTREIASAGETNFLKREVEVKERGDKEEGGKRRKRMFAIFFISSSPCVDCVHILYFH